LGAPGSLAALLAMDVAIAEAATGLGDGIAEPGACIVLVLGMIGAAHRGRRTIEGR
jgi:hypothetical protein